MIDQAREWLERLHASNAPEADMALDLLARLDELQADAQGELADALMTAADLEREAEVLETERRRLDDECDALTAQLTELEEALGADGPEEAIAMARTLREAFE